MKLNQEVQKGTKVKKNSYVSKATARETESICNRRVTGLKEKKIKVLNQYLLCFLVKSLCV